MSAVRTEADGGFSAHCAFPAGFTGFRGHFAGKPVLPGVCLVQAALVLAERAGGEPLRLLEVASAKFFRPVLPEVEVLLSGSVRREEAGTLVLKVRVTGNDSRIADFALRCEAETR